MRRSGTFAAVVDDLVRLAGRKNERVAGLHIADTFFVARAPEISVAAQPKFSLGTSTHPRRDCWC
jgi:hypothetical protein